MTTKTNPFTDEQKRAVRKIERLIFARDDAAYREQTAWANENFERLKPIVERAGRALNDAIGGSAANRILGRVACNPPADEAVLAVVAKPYISQADHDSLIEGWVKFFGSVPS